MKLEPVSARRRIEPGRASNCIHHLDDLKPVGTPAVLVCRVSGPEQERLGTPERQEANLRRVAEEHGLEVVEVHRRVGQAYDPSWLEPIAEIAKRHGAILLAETTDRFIRHPGYSKTRQGLQARAVDLDELERQTLGVTLVTVLHPDATPLEVRSYQRKRGLAQRRIQTVKTESSPGYKKRRRQLNTSKVFWLHSVGFSVRKIAKLIGVSHTTVQDWITRLRRT